MQCAPHREIQPIGHIRKNVCTPYQEILCMSKLQYIRHLSKPNVLYAASGNTKRIPHQEIKDVRHIRKCYMYVSLKKSIHATSGDTIYWTPHQEMQKSTPHQEIQYIRHIRKCYAFVKSNINATSGNTRNTSHQENIGCTPYQEMLFIVCHMREYKKYVTSGNTGYTPYQEMLRMSKE